MADADLFLFSLAELTQIATRLKDDYAKGDPFPYIVIDDFLPEPVARRVMQEFPGPGSPIWLDWEQRDTRHQPLKLGIGRADRLGDEVPFIQHVLLTFNSAAMIQFLEQLTGINGLIPDPHLAGGGLHQILSGGRLSIHSDFNVHPIMHVYRRINVLLYLNEDWRPEYGGNLELWSQDMTRCVKSVPPLFNRCVIFNTDRTSFHGHPHPLETPEGLTRKSLALYYYTAAPKAGEDDRRPVLWQARPGGEV